MISRRQFLKSGSAVAIAAIGGACRPSREAVEPTGVMVNDIHSGLNATEVRRVVRAESVDALRDAVDDDQQRSCGSCTGGHRGVSKAYGRRDGRG